MSDRRHYSEKGGHRERRDFSFAQRLRERYFPGMHFRSIEAPVLIQNAQSFWVGRERQPNYDRR